MANGIPCNVPRTRPSAPVLHGGWVLSSGETPAGFAIWGEQPGLLGGGPAAGIVAARFALSLLARQRFLPRVSAREGDAELVSRWSPVMDDPSDRSALRTIERSMAPAAVALAWDAEGKRA